MFLGISVIQLRAQWYINLLCYGRTWTAHMPTDSNFTQTGSRHRNKYLHWRSIRYKFFPNEPDQIRIFQFTCLHEALLFLSALYSLYSEYLCPWLLYSCVSISCMKGCFFSHRNDKGKGRKGGFLFSRLCWKKKRRFREVRDECKCALKLDWTKSSLILF